MTIQSIPGPTSNAGIWIEFQGSRWFSAGAAASFDPSRFTRIGEMKEFAVYRAIGGSPDEPGPYICSGGSVSHFATHGSGWA